MISKEGRRKRKTTKGSILPKTVSAESSLDSKKRREENLRE